ncbi:AAA family ATPase [Cytobacillus praedii]|uniref:AAA family ATPase n=1 Tax=Cytobacillus praedii TaxID=1742358 RepID=UPI002E1F1634|nr:AAA family ATPase [Cytobacillus praedii]MED3576023.1 AAA family ATPase [Cytobacillus praedii]
MSKAKFSRMDLNEASVNMFSSKIPDDVDSVEESQTTSHKIYRIKFSDLDPYAYLLIDTSGEIKFYHYCEANEKKSQCKHLGIGAAITQKLGHKLEKVSMGLTISELEAISVPKDQKNYTSLNSLFELLEPVEEDKPSTSPAPATTPAATTSPARPIMKKRDWTEGWNSIQDYLKSQRINTRLIARIQKKRSLIHDTVSLRPMTITPKEPNFPYQGEMLSRAIRHILNGKDLILFGDKGSGKDTLIHTLSWIFGLPMTIYVGNRDETKESLVGEPGFRNGESTFDPSELAKTIENGGIINMAEVNMLVGDVTSILHSVADENRVLASPIGAIRRHEHSLIIGSMNVGEGYAGVKQLNEAFKDRFAILRLPYALDFKKLIEGKTGLSDSMDLAFLEKVKKAIDRLITEESQGSAADTIRGYIDAANYFLVNGTTFETKVEVIEDYIINSATRS